MIIFTLILWVIIGTINLFAVDEISKLSYALLWIVLLLNLMKQIF